MSYKEKGVLFLGVFTMSKEKDVRKFSKEYKLTYPVGLESGIAEALGAKGIPETFFIDREGGIARRISGTVHYKELAAGIEAMLD